MRYILVMALLSIPLLASAQKNETIKANKHTRSIREDQEFIFPDHIKLSKNKLNDRVAKKTKELTHCIKLLAENKDKNTAPIIAEAMKLFNNNEKAMVSVTRAGKPEPETMPIRAYLERLARLKYDKVRIVWHNAQYVSNFTRQPDGLYTGLVAFEQEFTGLHNGEVNYVYHDVTQKRIEVSVRLSDVKGEGESRKIYMDVFLGNIGVAED